MAGMHDCCRKGFQWSGQPSGKEGKVNELDVYISGEKQDRAIMICHDALGWKMKNTRLLADHFAKEVGATVYLPDFFHGMLLPSKPSTRQARYVSHTMTHKLTCI